MAAPLLNIAALARRTGVAADTLRKWEQRYGVVRPIRTAGGQRRYTETDVQRVQWLRNRIRDGWRVGEAARVLDEEGVALDDPVELRDAAIAAIRESQPQALNAVLDQAFSVLPLERALSEVVAPALHWTGTAWESGTLSVAQEHAISAKVRAHLGKLLADGRGGVHGIAVLACAPGELHDIGLLMLGVMLRADGWRVEFLGADTPVDTALAFATDVGASMLCWSAARTETVESLREALEQRLAGDGVTLVIGGAAVTPATAEELRATYADPDLDLTVARLRTLASV